MNSLFEERRSINHFDKEKGVSDDTLKNIINTAVLAPSAFNLQPWDIIVVKTDASKEKLFNLSNQQPKVLEAPVTLMIIGNRNGFENSNPIWSELEKVMGEHVQGAKDAAAYLYGSSEERQIKFAESNAGLLGMSLMYAAKHHGVDSHPMSGVDFGGLKEAFGLKDYQEVVMTIALGHFNESETLNPRGYRRLFEEVATVV